jgi:hypothetical protein
MPITILGDPPLALDEQGRMKCRIATLIVSTATLITRGRMHALQRQLYIQTLNEQRAGRAETPLSAEDETEALATAVDLILSNGNILIRPDPDNMPLAFAGDQLLQDITTKRRVRFLSAQDERVRRAIQARGEYWRIAPVPQTPEAIARGIAEARIAIAGRAIYYYSASTGTRFLTVQEFEALGELNDEELRRHLVEIRDYIARRNRLGRREIAFFAADPNAFNAALFEGQNFEKAPVVELRSWHKQAVAAFRNAVPPTLQHDLLEDLNWRNRMFAALMGDSDDTVADVAVRGLTPEFFRQIRWLPGGRIEHGELTFDTVFNELENSPNDAELRDLCDERVKRFIFNYVREFGTLEHINIGQVAPALRRHGREGGHRTYLAEVKYRGGAEPILRIIRVQKWGINEHLDAGKELLHAIMEAEEYTEYTLDRRLGCWQLGMPMPNRTDIWRIEEVYRGVNQKYRGTRIWTTCFERDFIGGMATDKIPKSRFEDDAFALSFACLLGAVAAPNMVVGRTNTKGHMIIDDGDEVLVLDTRGQPERIIVADHAGTFNEFTAPLSYYPEEYIAPVLIRAGFVPNLTAFADAYVNSFVARLDRLQRDYREQRRAFDTLFKHSKQGEGTFAWRWAKVLARLDATDVTALGRLMRNFVPDRY